MLIILSVLLVIIILSLLFVLYIFYKKNIKLHNQLCDRDNNRVTKISAKNFITEVLSPVIDLYQRFNFVLYLFGSIILYFIAAISNFKITIGQINIEENTIKNIITTIATVILSSGVFSSITKSKHFLNIFSKEMKKIVFLNEYISKQKNIDEIWSITTKSLCSENFHRIGDKLFDTIKKTYLPVNHNFYYENFNLELVINIDSEDPNYLVIEEKTKVDLICEDEGVIDYKYSSNIDFDQKEREKTEFEIIELNVNGKDCREDLNSDISDNVEASILEARMVYPLSGSTKYSISRVEKKKYHVRLNSNRVHSAVKIYNNFQLSVF